MAGKIEKTKLTSEGEFDEKVNKYLNRKKITMPNVKEGSVIEFEYLLETENLPPVIYPSHIFTLHLPKQKI